MPPVPQFTSDLEIVAIGEGLRDLTLPKSAWTHAAHFAAALWLLTLHPKADAANVMPPLIRAYNESTGVANTGSSGYHETITQASLRAACAFLGKHSHLPLHAVCNELLASPLGNSGWLLDYWSRALLFSPEARAVWTEPDLRPFPYPLAE